MARKSFVLDTNVLIHNPNAVNAFADNEVVIPMTVVEELDNFKHGNDDNARHARQVIRTLDRLREKGRLTEGVSINEEGGSLRLVWLQTIERLGDLDAEKMDNAILAVAYQIYKKGQPVVFVSKDIDARLKADALGMRVMDFEKQKVDFDHLYVGWRTVPCDGAVVDQMYRDGRIEPPIGELSANEFLLLQDEANPKHTAAGQFVESQGAVHKLSHPKAQLFGVSARNLQQTCAIELLLDDRIELVTLVGQAGTGKTLLAVACGLFKVQAEKKYEKLLVSRPIMPMGKDIGFLPGTKEEKLANWMQPIFDNLGYLLGCGASKGKGKGDGPVSVEPKVRQLQESGTVQLEALTYIRGRSIPRQYMIVDEAQILTPHEVKTIISRAGEDTKIVLTGDPYQIDNPYLDASSNGLTYAVERMRGQSLFGHITLEKSERSTLASVAAERL